MSAVGVDVVVELCGEVVVGATPVLALGAAVVCSGLLVENVPAITSAMAITPPATVKTITLTNLVACIGSLWIASKLFA